MSRNLSVKSSEIIIELAHLLLKQIIEPKEVGESLIEAEDQAMKNESGDND